TVNGEPQEVRRDGDFLVFGKLPENAEKHADGGAPGDNPLEHRAAGHYAFLPEEVHLRGGGEREVALRLRCVGRGEAPCRLRLVSPNGITVEPVLVDLGRMSEGEEKAVRLRVRAAADAANALHTVRVEPDGQTPAAVGSLL